MCASTSQVDNWTYHCHCGKFFETHSRKCYHISIQLVYTGRKEFVAITNWWDRAQDVVPSFQSLHTSQSKPGMRPLEASNPVLAQCLWGTLMVVLVTSTCHC